MRSNSKKLWIIFPAMALAIALSFFVGHTAPLPNRTPAGAPGVVRAPEKGKSGLLTEGVAEKVKDARKGRSPAYVPGSGVDVRSKQAVEALLAEPKLAATDERLKTFFPESAPINLWLRASIVMAEKTSDRAITPEQLELADKIYAQILTGDEAVVASLDLALNAMPRSEDTFRRQTIKMLSDVGMQNRGLREAVKTAMLSEAVRARNHPDAAVALTALLRVSPTSEWFNEVNRSYERLHPGADLSDFVALKVVSL